jgi:Ca2+-binding RTX toxin-like protein
MKPQLRLAMHGHDDIVFASADWPAVDGGAGDDTLLGSDAADIFVFHRGSGADLVVGFETGHDTLRMMDVSPRTVSLSDTPDGLVISYSRLGGETAQDHVLLQDVHQIGPADFWFT